MRLGRTDIVSMAVSVCMVLACAVGVSAFRQVSHARESIKVGFVYDGDETEPYTYNFMVAQRALKSAYGDRVEIEVQSNVADEDGEEAILALVDNKCDLIFTTSWDYGKAAKRIAAEHPKVQFCQATCTNANTEPVLDNYHTFMGHIYEGRYVSGVVAGLKIQQMIDRGLVDANAAKVGYVAAFESAENISAYTAFLLGVRSVVPTATMEVSYMNSWSSYAAEKECAERFIEDGCVVISQSTNTIGPALACEEASATREVYHVGYNESMAESAPTMALVCTRINWSPYVLAAADAVLQGVDIEDNVSANIHGKDAGAGFDKDWVQMLDLNALAAPEGAEEAMEAAIDGLRRGRVDVFKGDYVGVNPSKPSDTCDLSQGYQENASASAPSFCYVLEDVITVV
ncbi:MAG: BMP family ABC transporter substrate-binding protein [Coriobacteriales bacterium]|nr:BMP family ABC transporter substrate-binding protein [Coriobacteriales bacterium]